MGVPGRLRRQTVVVEHWADSASVDQYGNPVRAKTGEEELQGYVEQTDATEVQVDRDTLVSNWLLVLDAGAAVDGGDRVRYDGATYEVIGDPDRPFNPRLGREGQVEARLRKVTG